VLSAQRSACIKLVVIQAVSPSIEVFPLRSLFFFACGVPSPFSPLVFNLSTLTQSRRAWQLRFREDLFSTVDVVLL